MDQSYEDGKTHGRADAYLLVLDLIDQGLTGDALRDRVQEYHDEAENKTVDAALAEGERRSTN